MNPENTWRLRISKSLWTHIEIDEEITKTIQMCESLFWKCAISCMLEEEKISFTLRRKIIQEIHTVCWWAKNALSLKQALRDSDTLWNEEFLSQLGSNTLVWHLIEKGIQLDQILKRITQVDDIPVQAVEAVLAKVPDEYNATVWTLKGEDWKIIIHPLVLETFRKHLWEYFSVEDNIKSTLDYQKWDGRPDFIRAMQMLMNGEEELYDWGKPRWTASQLYFIPGWWGWLTLFKNIFLDQGTPVLAAADRWPNIDGSFSEKTRLPITNTNFFDSQWNLQTDNLESKLEVFRQEWIKKIWIYLNHPNNPTGKYLNQQDIDKVNACLKKFPDIEINIVIDDPYGAYALKENLKVKKPLSYMIDTPEHVTIMDLGSHGTKEAGVYGLRSAAMRIIAQKDRIPWLQDRISDAIRRNFSMSPSIPQLIAIKAILWSFDTQDLSDEQLQKWVEKYLIARQEMSKYVLIQMQQMKTAFYKSGITEIEPLIVKQNGVDGFFLTFKLSNIWEKQWLCFEDLRKKCIHAEEEKISFAVFENNISWEQLMRVTLIAWDANEYFRRMKTHIE